MVDQLEEISGIGKATADRMKAAGIDTIEKLATVKPDELLKLNIKGIGETTATKYIEQAREIYDKSAETKQKSKSVEKKPEVQKAKKESVKPSKKKEKKPIPKEGIAKLKEQIKNQAECNIGLVGHVDHGKTTLVQALTGDWTDRHSEEQERGISIKLGYSNTTILYCPACDQYMTKYMADKNRKKGQPRFTCPECGGLLEFKRNISFVDAPGHEILMATMLSGASLMDGACLLIAADEECPQPQTREHLAALNIAGIENIIIIQNKIDAVSRERALENLEEIKDFVKGTVAEDAPVIPTSAVFGANIEGVVRAFEDVVPSPELNEKEDFQFLVARSFDINRPGTEIEDLKGGVIGGSVLKGKVNIGDKIEIRPGLRIKEEYKPIKSKVVSISQGRNLLEVARPGGLIGIGTKLDPALTKGDALIGHLVGREGNLPEILSEIDLEVHLLDRVIGSENLIKVHDLKHNERLLLVVGTEKTGGIVTKILKDRVRIKLNPPICPAEDFIFAISRIINRRYRLIGYGIKID
ncbi:MAG: translation initiation factor IF-2 subunit gamma [Candidatus Lokiarchaeota archaeon]|nr:translation initiation factor IF-2 subunit gamma [Candidatus Lokiarchaeota archaeon]MBD3341993.1 translation initiation factor IF-2 subunit gamma [Candidatus Lokiarchaeota archaeon]